MAARRHGHQVGFVGVDERSRLSLLNPPAMPNLLGVPINLGVSPRRTQPEDSGPRGPAKGP